MRLLRSLGNLLSGAVLALVLPLSQANAQECVLYSGLNHCGLGSARVSLTSTGVRVDNGTTTGQDGVAINTGQATNWTAATFVEGDGTSTASRTVLSSVSEGSSTSTATLDQRGDQVSYASTFTGAGSGTTYSLLVYRQGILQASVGGVRSGTIGVISVPNPGWTPYCRPVGQTYNQCINSCIQNRYINCNYCSIPCRNTFHTTPRASCEWRFDVAHPSLRLPDGRIVQGDSIVMSEEVNAPSQYPYLGFDQIRIQTTAKTTLISNESVVSAK